MAKGQIKSVITVKVDKRALAKFERLIKEGRKVVAEMKKYGKLK